MTAPVFRGPFVAAAFAGLVYCCALQAQTPAAGPWSKVPAPPTACFQTQDQYGAQNSAALDAVNNDHYQVSERNSAIGQRYTDALSADPMAAARAMQEAMMADPQNAQKYMERMLQQGQAAQTERPAALEREAQIEAEGKTVIKQYHAALAAANGPADARWTALKKRYGLPADARGPGESGVADWVWAEWGVILHERDQAYRATCATWFAPTGQMQSYLQRYKTFLIQERIPYEKRTVEQPLLEQFQQLNVSTAGYRTTTDYEAVEDYLRAAREIFDERPYRPYCGADGRCE